jgi:hypothetical protein
LIAWLSHLVGHFVTAIGTHTVAGWPGRLGTTHATRPTSATAAATTATATTSTSSKKPSNHRYHLLPQT